MANNKLADALYDLGLIDPTTQKANQSLNRVEEAVAPTISRKAYNPSYTTGYDQSLNNQASYLDDQKKKYEERINKGGLLNTGNLESTNPFVSIPTNVLNLGGRFLGGLGDAALGLYALDKTTSASGLQVPDDVYNIYKKQKTGQKLTEQESQRLNSKLDIGNNLGDDFINSKYRGFWGTGKASPTYADVIEEQQSRRADAKWATDVKLRNKLSNESVDDDFNASLGPLESARASWESAKQDWGQGDYGSAVGNTVGAITDASGNTLRALRENPSQLVNMTVDTLPFLLNKTANTAMMGDAGRIYSQGVNKLVEREGTQAPSLGQDLAVMGTAGAYTALNYLERVTELGALRGALPSTGASSVASNIAGKVSQALPESLQTVGKFLPTSTAGTILGNAAKAAGMEAVAEGFQQQIEDSWSNLSTDFNVVDNTVAATMGGVMGAGFSLPGSARQIGAKVIGDQLQDNYNQRFGDQNVSTDDMINPESPNYAPDKAISRTIATMNDADADMDVIRSDVQNIRDQAYDSYTVSQRTLADAKNPQALEDEFATKRANAEAFFQANDETHPAWDIAKQKAEANETEYTQRKEAIENADIDVLQNIADEFKDKLSRVDTAYKQFNDYYDQTNPATEPQDEVTTILNAPSFDNVARMQEIASDESVPENIRNRMRVVSEALIAENKAKSMGDITKSVLKGTDGFRGTSEYLKLTNEAVSNNNERMFNALTDQITRFQSNLDSKISATEQAQMIADTTGRKVQVVRNTDGTWYANENNPIPAKEFKKNNGLIIHPMRADGTGGSARLLTAMQSNLEAVNSTALAMQEMGTSLQPDTNVATDTQSGVDVNTDPNSVPSTIETYPTPEVYPPDADVPATPNPYRDDNDGGSRKSVASANPADVAIDQMNANERTNGRDTSARDNDPKAKPKDVKPKTLPEQAPSLAETELVFDENGVGSNVPKQKASEQSVSEAKPAVVEKPKRTKKEAKEILNTKFSPDTHEVFEKESGGFGVRKRKLVEADIDVTVDKVTETESADQSPVGGLDVLNTNGKSYKDSIADEASKPFAEQNLVKTGFVQRLKEGNNSPLVMIKDFMQTMPKTSVAGIIGKYTGKPATPSQIKQLEYFFDFNNQMNSRFLTDDFIKQSSNIMYRNEAYAEFLLSDNGQLEQNLRTAINAASMEWLGEYGSTVYSDANTIGKALGVKNLEEVPVHIMARMGSIGTHQNTLAATLGSRIMQALQIKALNGVDKDRRSKLEQTLGMLAVTSMLEAKLVQRTGILNSELMEMQSELTSDDLVATEINLDQDPKAKRQHTLFIRPALEKVDGKYQVTDAVANIAELNKDTKGVMSTIFGYQPLNVLPSLEPITELPSNTDEVGTEVPSYAQDVIKKMQSTPRTLNTSMMRLYDAFNGYSKDMFEAMMGVQDPEQRHAFFKLSTESKNEQIRRSLGILESTRSLVGSNAFYLPMTFWVNNRSGYGSLFNPQGDKIHRAFSSLATNQVTVDITDRNIFDSKGKLTEYGQLLRGLSVVIEDVKVPGYGKAGNEEVANFLPAFEQFINSPKVREATTSLNKIKDGEAKAIDYRNVADMVIDWGIQGIGLVGLDTIAEMHSAIDGNKKSVTVTLAPGSDGVNSGASWSQILMGTATTDVMNAVGVFGRAPQGSTQFTNIAQFKSNGGKDLYEQLGERQALVWANETREDTNRGYAVRALDFIDTAYGTRSGAKNAFNPFNYGSGIPAIKRSDARATLDAVYSGIESVIKGSDKANRDVKGITAAINAMIRFHNETANRKVNYVDEYTVSNMEETLPKAVENAIFRTDIALRGEATETAIRESMSDFIKRRDSITSMSDNSNALFNVLRNFKLQEALSEYNSESNPSMFKGEFLEGLTTSQVSKIDAEIARYMPSVATPMSARSENKSKSRIPLLDTTYAWDMNKRTILKLKKINYQFTSESSDYVSNIHNKKMREGNTANSYFDTYIRESTRTGLGVGTHARFIQSHDAFVTFTTMGKTTAENNHDENTTDIFNLDAMSEIQNTTYLQGLASSNLGLAYATALLRPLNGIFENQESIATDASAKSMVSAILGAMNTKNIPHGGFKVALPNLIASMIDSDIQKVTTLQNAYAINQYATEGGEILVSDTDRKYMADVKASLVRSKTKLVEEYTKLGEWVDQDVMPRVTAPKQTDKTDRVPKEAITQSVKEYGPSRTVVRSDFQSKLFGNTTETTTIKPQDLTKLLNEHLANYTSVGGSAGFYANTYKALFGEMIKAIPDIADINLIHAKDGNLDNILGGKEQIEKGQRAWYASKGHEVQINFYNGSKTPISVGDVVHEVIHASTEQAIKAVEATPDLYPKARQSLDKLKRLYAHVKDNSTSVDNELVKYGISNLDEFIATGLTNPAFIKHLDAMPATIEERGLNKLTTAFRAMVSNLFDLLRSFTGKTAKYDPKSLSAYEALIMDTAEFVGRTQQINGAPEQLTLLGAPHAQAVDKVAEYTAREVFEAIDDGKLDPEFKAKLGDVITNVTDKLFSTMPNQFARTENGYSPEQIWDQALQTGKAPYLTKAISAGFNLTAQEQFGVEAIEVALTHSMKDKSLSEAFKAMDRAYTDARTKLTVKDFHKGDWSTATADQRAVAKTKYDHVFKVGRNEYLARFTALGLASKEFNDMLDIAASRRVLMQTERPSFEGMVNLVNKAVNVITNRMTTAEQLTQVNQKLTALASDLINLDLKSRNKAVNKIEDKLYSLDETIEEKVADAKQKAGEQVKELPDFDSRIGKIVTNTIKTSANDSLFSVFDVLADFRNQDHSGERLGFLGELNNEIKNNSVSKKLAERLINFAKQNEGTAERIKTVTKMDMLSQFNNEGRDLTLEDRTALTYVGLRTDMQSLLDEFTVPALKQLLTDSKGLDSAITKFEKLVGNPVKISRAKDLAWYMVSGQGSETLGKNAEVIAYNLGLDINTAFAFPNEEARNKAVADIDKLVSLYAIKYSDKEHVANMARVMETEQRKQGASGVNAMLKYHRALVNDSKEVLFQSNPYSMIKGYMPEITNPHKDVVVANNTDDKQRLENAFYHKVGDISNSKNDPRNVQSTMYYSEDAGHQRQISGAMAMFNYDRKGTEIGLDEKEMIDVRNNARTQLDTSPNYDPRKNNTVSMIPSYDKDGNITAYNYEMSARVRDTYLERNNDFSDLVGAFTSMGYTKVASSKQNMVVVEQLHKDYKEGFRNDPSRYVYVGYNTEDPVVYRAWDKVPRETKEYIKEVWGEYGMYVSNDAFLSIFGTPKYTVTKAFDKDESLRNMAETAFVETMRIMFGDNARVRAAKGERIWQEGVALLKNFVVIRNVTTMMMNLTANTFLLAAHGVKPSNIIKDTIASVRGGMQYRRDMTNLIRLQNKQRANLGHADKIQEEINRVQLSLNRNPLKDFIAQGMFAGIVEDIDPSQDMYSYKSGLERKYAGYTDMVPDAVKEAGKWLLVSPGTPHYQFLHSATQYSDFSAKYVLFKHYSEYAKKRLPEQEALQIASDNFINYDVPSSQGLEYMNNMGLVMFTKYNLRIQKALFQLLAKRPAQAIGQAMLMDALTNLPPGIDPIVFNQYGIPFRDGALGLFDSWDEPFPIKLLKDIF